MQGVEGLGGGGEGRGGGDVGLVEKERGVSDSKTYLAISQLRVVLAFHTQPHGNDHVADLVVLVEGSIIRAVLLCVKDLAPQWQNCLELAIPGLLGASPCITTVQSADM